MVELAYNTKQDSLLSGPGIPFPIRYPVLGSCLDVSLHLEGTMTCSVRDDSRYASADTAVLCEDICSSLAIAVSAAAEQIGHPSRIPEHAEELAASIRERLAGRWAELYGAEPGTLVITKVSVSPEDQAMMEKMEKAEAFAGKTKEEQISAMAGELLSAQAAALSSMRMQTASWTCTCGAENKGNFCTECGKMRVWTCGCGALNSGNFCPNCGKKRA